MKILLYGYDKTIRRIKSSLEFSGAEIVMGNSGLDNVVAIHDEEGLSMAIIDVTALDAHKVYDHIKKFWDIPVVLVLSEDENDWGDLVKLDADGYLDRNAGETEIVARIIAVRRRVQKSVAHNGKR